MEFQHINVRIFVEGELPMDPSRFIEVFHRWIQEQTVPELLIDVADYCHVPNGPGVLLICHEADYSMDHTDGKWGMRYNRKMPLDGTNESRIRQALSATAKACEILEKQLAGDGLKFSRTAFEVFVNDRAIAPNTPEVESAFISEINSSLRKIVGHTEFKLDFPTDRRRRVGVVVTAAQPFQIEKM